MVNPGCQDARHDKTECQKHNSRCFTTEILGKLKLLLLQPRSLLPHAQGKKSVNGCEEPRSCRREQGDNGRAGKRAESAKAERAGPMARAELTCRS